MPGALHDVTIECHEHRKMYRGLLLYARSEAGDKVGEWLVPQEEPAIFAVSSSCPGSVMHVTASHKPYEYVFQWRAPAAPVGAVTFEALIKYGDANDGDFFYPNADGPLVLQPGAALAPEAERGTVWRRAAQGESCTAVCARERWRCDAAALAQVNSPAAMEREIVPHFLCKRPFVSSCGALGPTSSDDELGICYYHGIVAFSICVLILLSFCLFHLFVCFNY